MSSRPDALAAPPPTGSYFVSTYPPFSAWTRNEVPAYAAALDRPPVDPGRGLGLYVHIPFCSVRCAYCYYLSYEGRATEIDPYLEALAAELRRYAQLPAIRDRPIDLVYFGGGTPSLLSTARVERLLSRLRSILPWRHVREVTFECAPRSVTADKLRALRAHGVTRLSLGAQQLDDDVLRASGRAHLTADVTRAWECIREVGFDVVNVDLIAGLPGETDATFGRSLERLLELAPDSVTVYQLEVPLNTPLYRQLHRVQRDGPAPASWPARRRRTGRAFARLEQEGYQLRSGYTAVRDPERHGFLYQDAQYAGADLLGIGASAFSYLDGWHHQSLAALDPYLGALAGGSLPLGRAHLLSRRERIVREAILQLKLGRVLTAPFRERYGIDLGEHFRAPLAALERAGLIEIAPEQLTLTREGLLRVDELLPAFYLPEHRGIRYS